MTNDSKSKPKVFRSASKSFGPASRKYAAIAGSEKCLAGLVAIAVLDLSLGFQAFNSSTTYILERAPIYSRAVLRSSSIS